MDFLPQGFEELKTDKSYINLSKLPEGEHKFRIVMKPICGWEDWKDNKPYRFRPEEKPSSSFDPNKPAKGFWSCYVWDYAREGLFIMNVTQIAIIKTLVSLAKDEDWGDFTQYDIKITKEGNSQQTKYIVNPVPHKPLNEKIKQALEARPVNLEALFDGGDPWSDFTTKAPSKALFTDPFDMLKEKLEIEDVPCDLLEKYLTDKGEEKNLSINEMASKALEPKFFPTFKNVYSKWLMTP